MAIERTLCPILVGREKELSVLEDALLAAQRGEGQVVILAGEAGLGKTRLATELQRRALKGGSAVMWGGCSEAELSLAYLPFLEAIGNYLSTADLDSIRVKLGLAHRDLATVLPQLATEVGRPDTGDPTQGKLRLFEAIVGMLRVAAEQGGLLLILEDLHWADASTRELLDFMTRRLKNSRILVLATYRSEEVDRTHPLLPTIQGWRRTQLAQVVDLEPLSAERVGDMVEAIFDQPIYSEFRTFLSQRSEGNPFVLEELLKAAMIQGDIFRGAQRWERKDLSQFKLPPTVRDTILLRVERLDKRQADVLRTGAVLGPSFSYSTLLAISGISEEVVQGALHASIQQQLIVEDPAVSERYGFRHALTREAIYDDVIAPKRRQLHALASEFLARDPRTNPSDLAHHLLAAGKGKESVPVLVRAAEQALAGHGYRDAAALFMRAVDHVDGVDERAGLLGRAGDAYWRGAETGPAAQALEEAIRLCEESGKSRDAARLRLLLGRCQWERRQSDLATLEYERARDVLERFGPSEDLALAYVRLAGMHVFSIEAEEARLAAERAIQVAEAAGADAMRIWAYNYLGIALTQLGRDAEGLEFQARSYREASELGLDFIAGGALFNSIVTRVVCFRAGECARLLQDLRDLSQRGEYWSAHPEHLVAFALGDLPKALKVARDFLARATELDHPHFRSQASRELGYTLTELGLLDEARAFVDRPATTDSQPNWTLAAAIRFYVATGETERIPELTRFFVENPQKVIQNPHTVDPAIEGLIAAGRLEEASEIVRVIKENHLKEGDPWRQRMEGRLLLAKGDAAGAVALFSAALAQFRNAGYRLEELISQLLLASAQTSMGHRPSAEANLREALVKAGTISAGLVARQAREQLRVLGVDVPTPEGLPADTEASHLPSERLVSILFVDVRRFTTMTKERAPADMVDRVSALYRWGRGEIEKHHGRVAHYAGDAIMATFNVAGARLDHTVHALQAALAIRDKAAYAGLPVGIGIAVGAAIVGEFTEGGGVTALGETPNLASRLQAQARDGEILLNDEAFRRVRDWLQEKQLPADEEKISVKGLETPVTAYRLREGAADQAKRAPLS